MRIAAIQMCASHNVEDNLRIANTYIKEAAQRNASIVVLPEMFATFGTYHDVNLIDINMISDLIISSISKSARECKIWVVAGTIPYPSEHNAKAKATTFVFNEKGDIVADYVKIHLFDVSLSPTESYEESKNIDSGKKLVIVDSPIGKLGLAVCYDIRFPELFRSLVNHGAEIIIIPSAFTYKTGVAHWEILTRSRAIENFCYVVAANQGGIHTNGRETYGNSLIIDPWGTVIAQQEGTNSGLIDAEIDLEYLKNVRASIPALNHQRISIKDYPI